MRQSDLTPEEMQTYALEGARAQLTRICEAFPQLYTEMMNGGARDNGRMPARAAKGGTRPAGLGKRMRTAKERAAMSRRMRKVWREKRREAAGL